MVKTPSKWILGANSIIILEAYITAPSMAKTAISFVEIFTAIPP